MREKLIHYICKILSLEANEIDINDNLIGFGLDSLRIIKLVNYIEKEFNVIIPYENVNPEDINSIHKIMLLINKLN